jgi:hypothetical protein
VFGEAGMQVEFVFERRVDLQAEVVAITFDFIAQQRARAGTHGRPSVSRMSPWMKSSAGAAASGPLPTVTRLLSRDQPQIAIRAPRVGRGDDVLRRQALLAGTQPQPAA